MRTLFTLFLTVMSLLSFPSWGMEFQCRSYTYMDCGGGNCNKQAAALNLTVDLGEGMVLRETKKNSKDFMKLKDAWIRDKGNSFYVLYEDQNSHGFVVLNKLSGDVFDYVDTLYTNFGGWVSSGECRQKK
jgi:hypothetical protein